MKILTDGYHFLQSEAVSLSQNWRPKTYHKMCFYLEIFNNPNWRKQISGKKKIIVFSTENGFYNFLLSSIKCLICATCIILVIKFMTTQPQPLSYVPHSLSLCSNPHSFSSVPWQLCQSLIPCTLAPVHPTHFCSLLKAQVHCHHVDSPWLSDSRLSTWLVIHGLLLIWSG